MALCLHDGIRDYNLTYTSKRVWFVVIKLNWGQVDRDELDSDNEGFIVIKMKISDSLEWYYFFTLNYFGRRRKQNSSQQTERVTNIQLS